VLTSEMIVTQKDLLLPNLKQMPIFSFFFTIITYFV